MPNASVRVIARVMANAASVKQVRAILIGVVEPTRTESGCLSYQLLQEPIATDRFYLCRRMGECRS